MICFLQILTADLKLEQTKLIYLLHGVSSRWPQKSLACNLSHMCVLFSAYVEILKFGAFYVKKNWGSKLKMLFFLVQPHEVFVFAWGISSQVAYSSLKQLVIRSSNQHLLNMDGLFDAIEICPCIRTSKIFM